MNAKNAICNTIILALCSFPAISNAASCSYQLTPAAGQAGSASVSIQDNNFRIDFDFVNPDALYTIWVDFKNRATGQLADDYPSANGALPRGVAPLFATTAGVTAGMGLDSNGVITDDDGNGSLSRTLDYNLLDPGASPVIGAQFVMQGPNLVGGGWLRVFSEPLDASASLQVVDPNTGLPLVQRSTAQGITVVFHPDFITHGHTPGVKGVDHRSAFSGDFPSDSCLSPDQAFDPEEEEDD